MSNEQDIDSIALDAAQKIMDIDVSSSSLPVLKAQFKAQIQCIVIDALKSAAPLPAEQAGDEPVAIQQGEPIGYIVETEVHGKLVRNVFLLADCKKKYIFDAHDGAGEPMPIYGPAFTHPVREVVVDEPELGQIKTEILSALISLNIEQDEDQNFAHSRLLVALEIVKELQARASIASVGTGG